MTDTLKSKIIIVDENDTIIGHKNRDSMEDGDMYRVSALWIQNSKGDILLAQRSFDKRNDPGKWGPAVAGTVEEGETYESNIIKEAEEEIGLKNSHFDKAFYRIAANFVIKPYHPFPSAAKTWGLVESLLERYTLQASLPISIHTYETDRS